MPSPCTLVVDVDWRTTFFNLPSVDDFGEMSIVVGPLLSLWVWGQSTRYPVGSSLRGCRSSGILPTRSGVQTTGGFTHPSGLQVALMSPHVVVGDSLKVLKKSVTVAACLGWGKWRVRGKTELQTFLCSLKGRDEKVEQCRRNAYYPTRHKTQPWVL